MKQYIQPELVEASEYRYRPDARLIDRVPMATVYELRSSAFPATNHVIAPGRKNAPSKAQAPYEFHLKRNEIDKETGATVEVVTGTVTMSGLRRERHRRLMDYVLDTAPPVPMGDGSVGFFIRRRDAAGQVPSSSHVL